MLVGIGSVTGSTTKYFVTNIVNRLVKLGCASRGVTDLGTCTDAGSALASNDINGKGFAHIERRRINAGYGSAVDQWNLDCLTTHIEHARL